MSLTFVYLFEAENGFIKIGISDRPRARLSYARCNSPLLLRLIACWPGDIRDEAALHAQYREQRSHGEWFRPDGDLKGFVERVRGTGVGQIEDWSEWTFATRDRRLKEKTARQRIAMRRTWQNADFKLYMRYQIAVGRMWSEYCSRCEAEGKQVDLREQSNVSRLVLKKLGLSEPPTFSPQKAEVGSQGVLQ